MKFIAYTDGGFDMTDQVGASAVVILNADKTKILYQWAKARKCALDPEKKQRNNEQEIGAVIHAVMSVPDGSFLEIYCDNQYVVNVLSGMWDAHANKELIERYFMEKTQRKISATMIWVRGHNGDKFNEMADGLCTTAANNLRNGKGRIIESKNLCYERSEK